MIHPEQQLEMHPSASIMEGIELTSEGYIGQFQQYTLKSVYQPIFSFAHDSPIGYEALLRVTDMNNKNIPPSLFFSNINSQNELFFVEKTSRTLHILNFFLEDTKNALLFININPKLIDNLNCLKLLLELLNEYNISPTRIVIEFVEESFSDVDIMIKATNYLRQSGCLIAIDDFGAGHSNFNRIWDFRPDIVKLDKSLIQRIRKDPYFHRPIANLIELLHESKSLVLIEGIEDEYDSNLAHELDVDLHQGYFLGYPKRFSEHHETHNHFVTKHNNLNVKSDRILKYNILSKQLEFMFRQAVMNSTVKNITLEEVCISLLNYPYTLLCYALDGNGYQIGNSLYGNHSSQNINNRFRKISNNTRVNWSRRSYFQRAIAEPMMIHSSRPYLSLTSQKLCITLSMAITTGDKTLVLCCDVKVPE